MHIRTIPIRHTERSRGATDIARNVQCQVRPLKLLPTSASFENPRMTRRLRRTGSMTLRLGLIPL